MLIPRALKPGATVALVAPASGSGAAGLRRATARLVSAGYRVKRYASASLNRDYLAAPDGVRARWLMRAFEDREVKAVFCERGGYGSLRILDRIDFGIVARNPKIFVGFSDVTVLHLAFWRLARLRTFYGPMPAFPWPKAEEAALWRQLAIPRRLGVVPPLRSPPAECLRRGRATGRLLGGTLKLVASLVGTRYLPRFDGALLVLEDVDERPYRIDGYLAQLKLAGVLARPGGVLLANFKRSDAPRRSRDAIRLREVFGDYFASARYPVAMNFPFGHLGSIHTLPLGARATLDAGRGTLELLEPGVRP